MNIGRRQPISQIAAAPPTLKTKVGMRVVTEKIPAVPYHRKFVNPNGHVVRVVLATGRTLGGTEDNPYGNRQWAEKIRTGWLPYSHCPIAKGYIRAQGEVPCDGPDPENPGVFWKPKPGSRFAVIEETCCKHIQQAIDERQREYHEKQREFSEQFKGNTDKLLDVLRKNAEDTALAVTGKKAFGEKR